ncbi:uncharacterized protein LOC111355254 [Spodoptera litura]|uniref:Uncharacterized protein LOC111355254 n=1 Tax=Spodoptera litura TaxID=69820 RepID=A0A9J7IR65_SPOLT|nr:uncharacterized protein LOC111355254 [Spodoptera litura]
MHSRSRRIIGLVEINSKNEQQQNFESESVILNPESPLPASCTFNESDWNNLKELVDEELSSDRNLVQEELHSFNIPSVRPCNSLIIEESPEQSSSVIMDSRETTPVPSPKLNFGSPIPSTSPPRNEVQEPVPSEQLGENYVEPTPSVDSYITVSECNSPCSSIGNKRKRTFKTNPGKKRSSCPEKWIDNKRKHLLNSGQQYVSRNGNIKNKKELRPVCSSSCKMKCSEKFDTDIRKNIFNKFWELADHTRQWEFINNFTEKNNKKRITTEGPSRRQFTTKYFLPIPADNTLITRQQVCLKTFLNTFCITDQFVRTAHSKLSQEGITLTDNRGKHSNHPNVVDTAMVKSVCDHVASFQPVESHYTRKDTTKLYLDNNLNMNRMFSLYKEWDQFSTYSNPAQTLRQYRDIINANMNVGFFIPKKDICDKCHSYSNNTSPTEEQIQAHNKHLENKTIAREIKNNDKEQAIKSPDTVCATFDFQKILNCPHGDVGLFYYKRKLSIFNFTVFDLGLKEGTCYMWTECTGKRGANEVSSCLMHFVNIKVAGGAKKFLFWSDNCAGQNRNRVVYSFYMYISKCYGIDITHRFMEQGHTQNEGDSVHALIERESKRKLIYTPDQWYALVRWAKAEGRPYNVVEVTKKSGETKDSRGPCDVLA